MKREDEWGEDTSRSRKMGGVYLGEGKSGGVYLSEGKNGGVYLGEEKNGGSTHLRPNA